VVPLAVLRQYVKVLLGEHGLELYDIGGQWSGSSMRLFTAPGSFCKTLGDHSCGSEIGLSELRENAYKEQSVSRLPIRAVHWWRYVFKL